MRKVSSPNPVPSPIRSLVFTWRASSITIATGLFEMPSRSDGAVFAAFVVGMNFNGMTRSSPARTVPTADTRATAAIPAARRKVFMTPSLSCRENAR